MRSPLVTISALATVLALLGACSKPSDRAPAGDTAAAPPPAAPAAAPRPLAALQAAPSGTPQATVLVNVRCDSQQVSFTLSPWTVVVKQDSALAWVLDPAANADSLTIEAKQGQSDWPYTQGPPYKGGKGAPVEARGMKPNQVGKRFGYNVKLTCTSGGVSHAVLIDPDLIVHSSP